MCVCVWCSPPLAMPAPPVLMLSQHVLGSGHEWGGLTVEFTNHAPHIIEVLYLEMVPWFFRLHLHTLSISGGIQEGSLVLSCHCCSTITIFSYQRKLKPK